MEVVILSPALIDHDAVSNDIIMQAEAIRQFGLSASIYTEIDLLKNREGVQICSKSRLQKIIAEPKNLIIYHHSIVWNQGKEILIKSNCKKIIKYHNITPPDFFKDYNDAYYTSTTKGRRQTDSFIQNDLFDYLTADSEYNLDELRIDGSFSKPHKVIPPFTKLSDFDQVNLNIELVEKQLQNDLVKVFFVGRFAPNKGMHHLVKTISTYIEMYGDRIVMNIAGGLDPQLQSYFKEVENLIEELHVGNQVNLLDKVSFADLVTYFNTSDVFLLNSEHEGFCVPILEAQKSLLPVIAYRCAAVPETLGPDQLIFDDLDYLKNAVAIHQIANNTDKKVFLAEQGIQNLKRFKKETITNALLNVINTVLN